MSKWSGSLRQCGTDRIVGVIYGILTLEGSDKWCDSFNSRIHNSVPVEGLFTFASFLQRISLAAFKQHLSRQHGWHPALTSYWSYWGVSLKASLLSPPFIAFAVPFFISFAYTTLSTVIATLTTTLMTVDSYDQLYTPMFPELLGIEASFYEKLRCTFDKLEHIVSLFEKHHVFHTGSGLTSHNPRHCTK